MKTFIRPIHTASFVAIFLTATLTSCGLFQKAVEAAWPLLGTYKMNNVQLELKYTANNTFYNQRGTTTRIPNDFLDFSTGAVTIGNTTYNYRQEKVNGIKKVVFIDQSTNEDVVSFTYNLSNNSLTLTSDNVIMGTTARERAQEALGWAATFGFGITNFPRITSATDASYGAFIINATK
ncbi:hypothetical protein [Runella sp. SP2]|uniref:hypothetical protein n=1 Tax=Runella sp. SP2 TaxID=2268026 RepID=UPI000F08F9D6|nr:hypothetical protein [Runella sp. SP2]AYQ35637.1 hypothetical protein DTQ70_27245 [Runella sp. SP2]